jgi:hypothetical protein
MKKLKTFKEQSYNTLFNQVCTCGKIYGDTCTFKPNDCPEFKYHKQAVLTRYNIKLKGFK